MIFTQETNQFQLLLTEMIFNGVFNTMTVEQCTALLSCLIFQEKGEMPKLTEELAQPLRTMQECARRIAKVSIECKLELDEEDYVSVSCSKKVSNCDDNSCLEF